MMAISGMTPPPPGMVYRKAGERVTLDGHEFEVVRVTESSATCRMTGTRQRSFTDVRTGKLVEFTAPYSRVAHITATRER